MRAFMFGLALACWTVTASAQRPIDATFPGGSGSPGFNPSSPEATTAAWSDDFNRADGPLGGSWSVLTGGLGILNNRGHETLNTFSSAQHNSASSNYATAYAALSFYPRLGGGGPSYAALIFGLGGADQLFLKVQDNNGDRLFDRVFFYKSLSQPWVGTNYFFDLAVPTASGRMSAYFTEGGDAANLDIDRDFDGSADEHFQVGGILTAGLNLGTGLGIGSYSSSFFDDWSARDQRFFENPGVPACLTDQLDFDAPYVPSGPVAGNATMFTDNGIALVALFGTWTAGTDVITSGSNDDGQSLVVQVPVGGSPTLAIAGVGQPLAAPAVGAGLDIFLDQPATSFGLLFVDQINFSYTVELFFGGTSLGTLGSSYSGSFPQPPRYWTAGGEWFTRVRVTFTANLGGVGVDRLVVQSPFFRSIGVGGVFPTSGIGVDGAYPWSGQTAAPSMPPNRLVTGVYVPANATRLSRVVIKGLQHPWSGDAHFVLRSPSGLRYNVACPVNKYNPSGAAYGSSCDYSGTYTFVAPSESALDFPLDANAGCTSGTALTPGFYHQYFGSGAGAWPASAPNNVGILNVPLDAIPIEFGTWTLECYDWYLGADSGSFESWELRGRAALPCAPVVYCTSGTSTNGCSASISASSNPSVSLANPCTVTTLNLEGQKTAMLFYGLAPTSIPWCFLVGTSRLCVQSPTQRTWPQNSGGANGGCNGSLSFDWNAYQGSHPAALGAPFTVGQELYLQCWYRDPPACRTTSLSNAVQLTFQP